MVTLLACMRAMQRHSDGQEMTTGSVAFLLCLSEKKKQARVIGIHSDSAKGGIKRRRKDRDREPLGYRVPKKEINSP
jgi:hypothetical protein